jgi:cell division septum initiation protein DivIVA
MAKELTLEQALEKIEALQTENAELKKTAEEATSKLAKVNNQVPGVYKQKESGKTYRFKKGFMKVNLKGTVHESVDVLKNAEMMDHLIEIGFGGIEIVEPSK